MSQISQDTNSLSSSILNPRLRRRNYKSTWMFCIIQREYSAHISLPILNGDDSDEDTKDIHAEAKFFKYWRTKRNKIFPDLPQNKKNATHFDLVWYMLRFPCATCTSLILDSKHLFNSLTIKSSSGSQDIPNTLKILHQNGVKLEPMSRTAYYYFTKQRQSHKLPSLPFTYDLRSINIIKRQIEAVAQGKLKTCDAFLRSELFLLIQPMKKTKYFAFNSTRNRKRVYYKQKSQDRDKKQIRLMQSNGKFTKDKTKRKNNWKPSKERSKKDSPEDNS